MCGIIFLNTYSPYIFNLLWEQLKWNSLNKNFINTQAATIRSFIEQIMLWTFHDKIGIDKIGDILNKNFINVKQNFYKSIEVADINNIIPIVFNPSSKEEEKEIYEILNDFILEKGKGNNLNEFIHTSHRIYLNDFYINNL